jgi:predicted dehydrogenase
MIKSSTRLRIASAIPRKLKWGVAGCGNFAENQFLPVLQTVQRSKLVSVFSHDLNRAKCVAGKFGITNAYDDFDAFLSTDFNALCICSANLHHYDQVIRAARAGKNILCESPMALSSAEAGEMINACRENNVTLIIDYPHRFHPHVLKAKELIDKKMLGKVVSISALNNIDYPPDDGFRFKKELSGGGALRDLGSPMIDMLRFFGGEITEVKGYMDNIVYKNDVEDFASAMVKFQNDGYGYFNVSYNSKKANNRIEILGHNGSIAIEDFHGKKSVSSRLIIDLHGQGRIVFRKKTNKLLFMIRSVQKTFARKEPPAVTGEDGLTNLCIIEDIEKRCNYLKF